MRIAFLAVALTLVLPAHAETTIDYVFDSVRNSAGREPVVGHSRTTSTIDGPKFRNVLERSGAIELSEDDGRTTYFGALHTTPKNTPLIPEVAGPWEPIVGSIDSDKLVIGESTPGPTMFGVPTRVYTVDYTYAIASRVVYVFRNRTVSRARFTFTVADIGVSSAALRVAFSRGYGYALCLRGEAFTGLPLVIDGTIESSIGVAHVHVEAASLKH